ncbi:MAG TPA: PqqD family protein [Mycobacteriales bacterium]|nr:PqqD family protein [Mycobacteriales bacterium]
MSADRIGPPQPGVRAVELGQDISLYNPRTRGAALLNSTASDVWRLLDGEHTLDQIVDLLGAAYDAAPELIRTEVRRTVDELTSAGFL